MDTLDRLVFALVGAILGMYLLAPSPQEPPKTWQPVIQNGQLYYVLK